MFFYQVRLIYIYQPQMTDYYDLSLLLFVGKLFIFKLNKLVLYSKEVAF